MTIQSNTLDMEGAASETIAAFPHPNSNHKLGIAEPADYFALMKPRVMSLVVFTAWVGLIAAPVSVPLWTMLAIILSIAVGAGASGALNMWYDADIDAQMSRTKKRPIPRGTVRPETALTFGIIMSAFAVLALSMASNYLAAGLLAFTIFFYAVIYSMLLKRKTPQNIVIGGAAGAFPPMIGWAAATGEITIDPIVLFLIIFLWTPPHFWALALYKAGDYEKVGIPMMPNVKGPASTRFQIFAYALVLAAICVVPVMTGLGGWIYGIIAGLLNIGFLAMAFRVWKSRAGEQADSNDEASLYEVKAGDLAARNLFAYSIIYLFAIFGALAAESLLKGTMT